MTNEGYLKRTLEMLNDGTCNRYPVDISQYEINIKGIFKGRMLKVKLIMSHNIMSELSQYRPTIRLTVHADRRLMISHGLNDTKLYDVILKFIDDCVERDQKKTDLLIVRTFKELYNE
jgi:hypothetical protein